MKYIDKCIILGRLLFHSRLQESFGCPERTLRHFLGLLGPFHAYMHNAHAAVKHKHGPLLFQSNQFQHVWAGKWVKNVHSPPPSKTLLKKNRKRLHIHKVHPVDGANLTLIFLLTFCFIFFVSLSDNLKCYNSRWQTICRNCNMTTKRKHNSWMMQISCQSPHSTINRTRNIRQNYNSRK